MRIMGGLLVVIGFWFMLHGGLSLVGGFGLERYIDKQKGREPETPGQMLMECIVGISLMSTGGFLRRKSLLLKRLPVSTGERSSAAPDIQPSIPDEQPTAIRGIWASLLGVGCGSFFFLFMFCIIEPLDVVDSSMSQTEITLRLAGGFILFLFSLIGSFFVGNMVAKWVRTKRGPRP